MDLTRESGWSVYVGSGCATLTLSIPGGRTFLPWFRRLHLCETGRRRADQRGARSAYLPHHRRNHCLSSWSHGMLRSTRPRRIHAESGNFLNSISLFLPSTRAASWQCLFWRLSRPYWS